MPLLPPKAFSPLAPDVIRERQKLLPVFLRELLAICRNDYGEELLADVCRPLVDEWLVSDPAAPPGAYAPFKHHFPIIRVKGAASLYAPIEQHRQDGGLWLALVAAVRIQQQFRRWRHTVAERKDLPPQPATRARLTTAAPSSRLVPRSPRDLRPVPRSVALDDSPARKPLLERMRSLSAQSGSPLVERMKALKSLHRERALASSPRSRPGDGPRYEVLRAAVVRAGYQLDSAHVGVVHAGAEVVALEERSTVVVATVAGGWEPQPQQQRATFRVRIGDGWVSSRVCAGGGHGSEPILKLLAQPPVPSNPNQPPRLAEEARSENLVLELVQSIELTVSSTCSRPEPVEHTVHLHGSEAPLRLVGVGGSDETQTDGDVSGIPVRGMPHREVLEMLRTAPLRLRVQKLPGANTQQGANAEEKTQAPATRPADSPHAIWARRKEVVQMMDMRIRQSPVSPSPSKQQTHRTPLGTLAAGNLAKGLAAELDA